MSTALMPVPARRDGGKMDVARAAIQVGVLQARGGGTTLALRTPQPGQEGDA